MAYSELFKNYSDIRNFMRRFYVYGFETRQDFKDKSSRSYDDERRRLESWLEDYMSFEITGPVKFLQARCIFLYS